MHRNTGLGSWEIVFSFGVGIVLLMFIAHEQYRCISNSHNLVGLCTFPFTVNRNKVTTFQIYRLFPTIIPSNGDWTEISYWKVCTITETYNLTICCQLVFFPTEPNRNIWRHIPLWIFRIRNSTQSCDQMERTIYKK